MFTLGLACSINRLSSLYFAVFLGGFLSTLYFIYSTGFTAQYSFDDEFNLAGLSTIQDFSTALDFVFAGVAGPLGRPLALATFLPTAASWPNNPGDFLYVNALIHLLNVLLVIALALRIVSLLSAKSSEHGWIALLVASLWGLSPLLASTSLSVIQRMTSLSACFMLIGLWLYVIGRQRIEKHPRQGLLLIMLGIGGGTVLGILSKEVGILLALYALVIECTLLVQVPHSSSKLIRILARSVLFLPIISLLFYLTYKFPSMLAAYEMRPFTMSQRVYSEWIILWDYLKQAFLPRLSTLGPFHDGYPVYKNFWDSNVIAAFAAWSIIILSAIVLRRRWPVYSFAIFWYLAGHFLESSFLNLELYFEHRNYLPIIGPVFLLIYAVWHIPTPWQKISRTVLALYIVFQAGILWQVCSLWGRPWLAAEFWHQVQPQSVRAAQFLGNLYDDAGEIEKAQAIVIKAAERNPMKSDLQLQILLTSCSLSSDQEFARSISAVSQKLHHADYSNATIVSLNKLVTLKLNQYCKYITLDQINNIADILLTNSSFAGYNQALHHLYHIKARIFTEQRLLYPTLDSLEKAFFAYPTAETAMLLAATLHSADATKEGIEFLTKSLNFAPRMPILRKKWHKQVNELIKTLEKSPNMVHSNSSTRSIGVGVAKGNG